MQTKIIYAVASTNDDIYAEQAILAAWSLRHYNPDVYVCLLCDQDTRITFDGGKRKEYSSLFNEFIVHEFSAEQSMMERSRWLKTNLRNLVKGDFLFLDTDTIVCSNLSFVDNFTFSIGLVPDNNCLFADNPLRDGFIRRAKSHHNIDISTERHHFNSGVIYSKDNDESHRLFNLWHKLWDETKYHPDGYLKDQIALAVADKQLGHIITPMEGDLNAQVMASIQHLHTGKILHIYNTSFGKRQVITPFVDKEFFASVKSKGITPEIEQKIINVKSSFVSPSMPMPKDIMNVWLSLNGDVSIIATPTFQILYHIYCKKSILFKCFDRCAKIILSVVRMKRKP